ncbi:NAD(P)-binding protein [Hypoxylon sp. FL1284]|nr:NAD(P)-binding protein [Hypoxylon sp. FL1284]
MSSNVYIVTGASRGLGLAIAELLVQASHKVFLVARSEKDLKAIKAQHGSAVEYMAVDLTDFKTAPKVVEATVKAFGKIDGIVLNHGVIAPLTRIFESSADEWREAYDINVFSAVALIKEAIPELRKSKGRVVFVSTGAAFIALSGWGAYGTSKAAFTHFGTHLSVEEPSITSVAISPGKVDTAMQKVIRDDGGSGMTPEVHASFVDEHEKGELLNPKKPGGVIAKLVVSATSDLTGKHFDWNAPELAKYQG